MPSGVVAYYRELFVMNVECAFAHLYVACALHTSMCSKLAICSTPMYIACWNPRKTAIMSSVVAYDRFAKWGGSAVIHPKLKPLLIS